MKDEVMPYPFSEIEILSTVHIDTDILSMKKVPKYVKIYEIVMIFSLKKMAFVTIKQYLV